MEKRIDTAWNFIFDKLVHPNTNQIYDYRSSEEADGAFRHLPTPEEMANEIKANLTAAAASEYTPEEKEAAVFNAIISSGFFSNGAEIENGYVIARYNLDKRYYGEMTDSVFSIPEGEVTDPISIVTAEENSYYVIYRSYKSEAHFEANYNEVLYVYLTNRVGEITNNVAKELMSGVSFSATFTDIDYSKIGM